MNADPPIPAELWGNHDLDTLVSKAADINAVTAPTPSGLPQAAVRVCPTLDRACNEGPKCLGCPDGPKAKPLRAPAVETVAVQKAPEDWAKIEAFTDEYVSDYEMRGESEDGRDACYTPNDNDRALLRDCIAGLLAEPEFLAMLAAPLPVAPKAEPANRIGKYKRLISQTIGYEWEPGELQTVNADDLLRLIDALATPQP